jgi:hypothetical protein
MFPFDSGAIEPEIDEQLVQNHAMQAIEFRPWQVACAHPVHRRLIAASPCVGEFDRVDFQSLPGRQFLHLLRDGCPPVHDGPERVEDKRFHTGEIRRRSGGLTRVGKREDGTASQSGRVGDEQASRDLGDHGCG